MGTSYSGAVMKNRQKKTSVGGNQMIRGIKRMASPVGLEPTTL